MALETVTINGVEHGTGWLPSPAESIARLHGEGILQFSHEHPKLKLAKGEVEWQEIDCRHFFTVENQGSSSMCVGGSGAMALGGAFRKEGFNVRFCPAAVYAPICGGSDNGASMSECLEALTKYGAWLAGFNGIAQFDWRAAYRTKFWQNPTSTEGMEAAKYRIIESVFCDTLDEWLRGIKSGSWAGQFGVGAGRAYDTDSNGSLPRCDGVGINHANMATGGMRKSAKGVWEIEAANPWGTDWGVGGFYYCDPYDWIDPAKHRSQELWLVRATTLPV